MFWACAQTHPRAETLAIRNLRRQHFTCFFPFFLETGRYKRQPKKITVVPVFPSYVFIELADEVRWAPVNSTTGIKRLLTYIDDGEYRRPHHVPFIEDLRRMQVRPDGKEESDGHIPIGTICRIVRGVFVEHVGLVEMSSAARVRLLIECFGGREIAVTFDAGDVEVISRPLE
jgi:transcription antitermination factor NusG